MSCPSEIYTVLSNAVVDAGASGQFGTTVRRYGRNLQSNGSVITVEGQGYYDIDASLTFVPTATGPVTIQFYQDGIAIPGALVTAQGTANEPVNLVVVSLMRNFCYRSDTVLTYTISADGTATNLATRVKKM